MNFEISTWLLIGAFIQGVVLLVVPYWWTLLLTALPLAYRGSRTFLITFKFIPNPYLQGVIHDFHTAQIPDIDGNFSDEPSSEQVAVLHLGSKFNHPMGTNTRAVRTFGKHFGQMNRDLDRSKATNGYLGGQSYNRIDERGCIENIFIAYFRRIEDIHDFAYGPVHRAGWEWWNKMPKDDLKYIGISHEIFLAPAHHWETVYLNFQPTLLAGTHSRVKGDKDLGGDVEDAWVRNLVSAKSGRLRTSAGRLGRKPGALAETYSYPDGHGAEA
jgi:hypothetical protein